MYSTTTDLELKICTRPNAQQQYSVSLDRNEAASECNFLTKSKTRYFIYTRLKTYKKYIYTTTQKTHNKLLFDFVYYDPITITSSGGV